MRKKYFALATVFLLAGCVTTKSVNGIVTEKYKNFTESGVQSQNFAYQNQFSGGNVATTEKKKNVVIPAFFYWKFSETYHTELHPMVPVKLFNKYADDYAQTLNLQQKLAGRKVELNVVSIPKGFVSTYTDKAYFFILAGFSVTSNEAMTDSEDLRVDYKVTDGQGSSDGTITVTPAELAAYNAPFNMGKKSSAGPKKFLNNFLDTYESLIYLESRLFVDKLIQKL